MLHRVSSLGNIYGVYDYQTYDLVIIGELGYEIELCFQKFHSFIRFHIYETLIIFSNFWLLNN